VQGVVPRGSVETVPVGLGDGVQGVFTKIAEGIRVAGVDLQGTLQRDLGGAVVPHGIQGPSQQLQGTEVPGGEVAGLPAIGPRGR